MSGRRQWADDSTVRVALSANASVTLTFHGNLFQLTREEQDLIASLSGVIQLYKAVAEGAEPAALVKEAGHE